MGVATQTILCPYQSAFPCSCAMAEVKKLAGLLRKHAADTGASEILIVRRALWHSIDDPTDDKINSLLQTAGIPKDGPVDFDEFANYMMNGPTGAPVFENTRPEKRNVEVSDKQEGTEKGLESLSDRVETLSKQLEDLRTEMQASKAAASLARKLEDRRTDDLQKRFESYATVDALKRLRARTEATTDTLLIKFETRDWLDENVNQVADAITNKFLRLVDMGSEQNSARIKNHEGRLGDLEEKVLRQHS